MGCLSLYSQLVRLCPAQSSYSWILDLNAIQCAKMCPSADTGEMAKQVGFMATIPVVVTNLLLIEHLYLSGT